MMNSNDSTQEMIESISQTSSTLKTHVPLFPMKRFQASGRSIITRFVPGSDALLCVTASTLNKKGTKAYAQDNVAHTIHLTTPYPSTHTSFLKQACDIFTALQESPTTGRTASHNYLQLLKSFEQTSSHFHTLYTQWGLIDMIHFPSPRPFLFPLIEWYAHNAITQEELIEITSYHTPHLHPLYIQTLVKAACLPTHTFETLCAVHPNEEVRQLVQPPTRYTKNYVHAFMAWKRQVSLLKDPLLVSLFRGDVDALIRLFGRGLCTSILVSFFTHPTMPLEEFREMCDEVYGEKDVVYAFLFQDFSTILREGDVWLCAHFVDLVSKMQDFEYLRKIVLDLFIERVDLPMIKLQYLKYANVEEMRGYSLRCLKDVKGENVLAFMKMEKMEDEMRAYHALSAREAYQKGDYVSALTLYYIAQDDLKVGSVCTSIVEGYVRGQFGCEMLHLACNLLTGEETEERVYAYNLKRKVTLQAIKIQFLIRISQYTHLKQVKKFKEGGEVLVGLFTSDIVPREYYSFLLNEIEELPIDIQDCYDMMRCLEYVKEDEEAFYYENERKVYIDDEWVRNKGKRLLTKLMHAYIPK